MSSIKNILENWYNSDKEINVKYEKDKYETYIKLYDDAHVVEFEVSRYDNGYISHFVFLDNNLVYEDSSDCCEGYVVRVNELDVNFNYVRNLIIKLWLKHGGK